MISLKRWPHRLLHLFRQVLGRTNSTTELFGRAPEEFRALRRMAPGPWELLRQLVQHFGPGGFAGLPNDIQDALRDSLTEISRLDCSDFDIRLHVQSNFEKTVRAHSCRKEPGTVAWLRQHLAPGDVVYDIGANVGAYSLLAAKVAGEQATVYAFEPSFLNFFQLCRNILLNDCSACVMPIFAPLCRATRVDAFYYQNHISGGSLHAFGQPLKYNVKAFEPVAQLGAIGFALDDLTRVGGFRMPTVIKIDVDGLEQEILEGAQQTLRHPGLRTLLIELNEDTDQARDCFRLLSTAGLIPVEKHQLVRGVHNFVFERRDELPGALVPTTWTRCHAEKTKVDGFHVPGGSTRCDERPKVA